MQPVIKKQFSWKGIIISWFLIGWFLPMLLVGGMLLLLGVSDAEISPIMVITLLVSTLVIMPVGVIFAALTRVRPEKRFNDVQQAAARYGYQVNPGAAMSTGEIYADMIRSVGDPPSDAVVMDAVEGNGWRYGEYRVTVYSSLNNGTDVRYKSSYRYHTVVAIRLPRILPNLFFDSHIAHGDTMRFRLEGTQRLSLEGNFDQYFTLYAPLHYPVDALTFITPEVMQAMIGAGEYDIEIVGDKLFLYGEGIPKDPAGFVPMAQKAVLVYEKLMNNIVTYRDERLPYDQGRQTVTKYASALQKSMWGSWAFAIGLFGVTLILLFGAIVKPGFESISTLVLTILIFIGTIAYIVSEYSNRKEAEAEYRQSPNDKQ